MATQTTSAGDPSSASSLIKNILNKPVIAGISASILDRYVMGVPDTMTNAKFGVMVAIGTSLGSTAGSYASSAINVGDSYLYNGATLTSRVMEISVGSGVAYLGNKYLLKNDAYDGYNDWMKRIGIIALSQVIAEYSSDIMMGSTPSYLM